MRQPKTDKDDLLYKDIIEGLRTQLSRQDNPTEKQKLREQISHYKKKLEEAKRKLGFKKGERTIYY